MGKIRKDFAFRGKNMGKAALISVLLCTSAFIPLSYANPEGGQVVGGSATITETGKKLDVYQHTDRTVIEWRSFNIDVDEHTQFHQPSSSATSLNRVKSADPSKILGKLSANGNIILVNPNGVFFGKDSVVDVNGLVATTADIDTSDFMDGSNHLNIPGRHDAAIINEGTITAKHAGLVGLVAPNVENHGIIQAKLGRVHLASGDTVVADFYGDGLLKVEVKDESVTSQFIANKGKIEADGGTVAMTAAAARNSINSLIEAKGELKAPTISKRGGKIIIQDKNSAGQILVSAKLDASGSQPEEMGGEIEVLGGHVGLIAGTHIDASGANGGGQVLVGGGYQGQGDIQTARMTYVDENAFVDVSAQEEGDGGRVIVWADDATRFYGKINADGGSQSGDGGFVEVSGKEFLDFNGAVSTLAENGQVGTLLLDPTDIVISNTANNNVTAASPFSPNIDDGPSNLNVVTLQTALAGANVVVQTRATGSQAGNITLADSLAWSSFYNLTLDAHDDIFINASMTATNGGLVLQSGADITASEAIDLNRFVLDAGNWTQSGTLPDFRAEEFIINAAGGANFLRAAGGNGTSIPFEIIDEYGLQGIATNNAYGNIIYAYRGGTVDHNGVYFDMNGNRQTDGTNGLGFNVNGVRYLVHKYIQDGSFTPVAGVTDVDVLIVAGGGAGGTSTAFSNAGSGGGGAGGIITGSTGVVSGDNYSVTVGVGGNPGVMGNNSGSNGGASSFNGMTALGGGGGIGGNGNGFAGGSGGGGRGGSGGAGQQPGSPSGGFGNAGGGGPSGSGDGGAGGGGAGSVGQNLTSAAGGSGGIGIVSSITGTGVHYGGGGGGGGAQANPFGLGGLGGGGAGANNSSTTADSGINGFGGGGGGGNNNRQGAAGGSGVTIIRYAAPILTIGGSFDIQDKIYDSTDTATITVNDLAPAGFVGLSNVILSDLVLHPTFASTDVGTAITVNLNPSSGGVAGSNASFYDLSMDNPVTSTANITPAALSVSAKDETIVYGDDVPVYQGIFTGSIASDNLSVLRQASYALGDDAGFYTISNTINDPDTRLGNYIITNQSGTLIVNKAPLNVTLEQTAYSRAQGSGNPVFGLSYSGFRLGQTANILDTPPSASTSAGINSSAGQYAITLAAGLDNNYDFLFTNPAGFLTVESLLALPSVWEGTAYKNGGAAIRSENFTSLNTRFIPSQGSLAPSQISFFIAPEISNAQLDQNGQNKDLSSESYDTVDNQKTDESNENFGIKVKIEASLARAFEITQERLNTLFR